LGALFPHFSEDCAQRVIFLHPPRRPKGFADPCLITPLGPICPLFITPHYINGESISPEKGEKKGKKVPPDFPGREA